MKLGLGMNTYAILIGIETYGEPKWTLNGPSMDALRVGTYLLSRGVPAGNIHLYINEDTKITEALSHERASLKSALLDAGAKWDGTPTRGALELALDPSNLPMLPGPGDKTLIIYSSGHGVWQGGLAQQSFLITEDASTQSYNAINLASVANQLCHHKAKNRFCRQWLIQDACAQEVKSRQIRALNVSNEIEAAPSNSQFILGASRPGAFAKNDANLQSGAFTAALLGALESYDTLDGLDIKELDSTIKSTPWGKANPSYLFHRDEFMQHSAPVPGCSITCHEALRDLAGIFDSTEKMTSELLRTVARRFLNDTTEFPTEVMQVLRLLDSVVGEVDCDLTTVEQFVIRLYAVLSQIRQQSNDQSWDKDILSLEQWIKDWPRKHANPAVILRLNNLRAENLAMARSEVIVIDLSGSNDTEETRIWGYSNGVVEFGEVYSTPEPTLTERLRSALMQVCAGFGLCGNTVFEVVLPAAEVFEPYSGLEFSMGDTHSYFLGRPPALLALRILERWHNTGWKRPWQRCWESADITHDRVPRMVWLQTEAPIGESGWSWHGTTNLDTDKVAIERSLRAGVACAAWCEPEHFENVTNIVQGEPYVRLLNTRISLADLNTSDRHGVTCILDTPERIPPGAGGASSGLNQPSVRTSA